LKRASAPPRSYGQRLELAEGILPRGSTCPCTVRAGIFSLFRCKSAEFFSILLRQRCGAAGSSLGTTTMHLRRATAWAPRPSTCDAQRAAPRLGVTIKYLHGAAGIGQGPTIKYLRCTTKQRPGYNDQVPATHNEQRRGQRPEHHDQVPAPNNERRLEQRPECIPGITYVPIHHKRPAFAILKKRASVANKQNSTAEVRGVGSVCVGRGRGCSLCLLILVSLCDNATSSGLRRIYSRNVAMLEARIFRYNP
jgi:hypothetical protein